MKLTVLKKGLFIVFLPLIFNALYLYWLDMSLGRATDWLEQSEVESRMIARLEDCISLNSLIFTKGTNGIVNLHSIHFRESIEHDLNNFQDAVAKLASLFQTDPEVCKSLDEIVQQAARQKNMLKDSPLFGQPDLPLTAKVMRINSWLKMSAQESKRLEQLQEKCHFQFSRYSLEEKAAQEHTQFLVFIGLILNFILACGLAFYFQRDIANRLGALVRNSNRIVKNEPLEKPIPGNDELKQLDETLHAASVELSDAAEHRRSLMQMMAHDMRTPLTSVTIALELLERSNPEFFVDSDTGVKAALEARYSHCIKMINDLLFLEGLETGVAQLFLEMEDVRELTDTAIDLVRELAKRSGVELINQTEEQFVKLDRDGVLLALESLLTSAIKFSPPDGVVHISSIRGGDVFRLYVKDLGPSFKRFEVERLFDSLQPTRRGKTVEGIGLGLAIARQVMVSHGGNIGVELGEKAGASFWLEWPCVNLEPETGVPG